MNKKEIENRLDEINKERKVLEIELKWVSIPDKMRDEFKLMFGWPKLTQELTLEKKLDKETYNKLYIGMEAIIERVVAYVPESKKSWLKKNK